MSDNTIVTFSLVETDASGEVMNIEPVFDQLQRLKKERDAALARVRELERDNERLLEQRNTASTKAWGLEKSLKEATLERDELQRAYNEKRTQICQANNYWRERLDKERDDAAERLAKVTAEREWLEKRVREHHQHQLPDLSQWPSGWAVGIETIDGINRLAVMRYEAYTWWIVKLINLDGTYNKDLSCPQPLMDLAKHIHRALGRPCPWDEDHEPKPGPVIEGSLGTKRVTAVSFEPWSVSCDEEQNTDHGKVTLTSKHPGPEPKEESAAIGFTGSATGSSATEATINWTEAGENVERVVFNGRAFISKEDQPDPQPMVLYPDEYGALLDRVAELERKVRECEKGAVY